MYQVMLIIRKAATSKLNFGPLFISTKNSKNDLHHTFAPPFWHHHHFPLISLKMSYVSKLIFNVPNTCILLIEALPDFNSIKSMIISNGFMPNYYLPCELEFAAPCANWISFHSHHYSNVEDLFVKMQINHSNIFIYSALTQKIHGFISITSLRSENNVCKVRNSLLLFFASGRTTAFSTFAECDRLLHVCKFRILFAWHI